MRQNHQVQGQWVWVTGASSGIGKACAEQFAALGAHLVITARRFDRLQALAMELTSRHGIHCIPIQMDVREPDQVCAAYHTIQSDGIQVDILVNNAGLALASDRFQEGSIEHWDTMIDTNIKGVLYVTRTLLPAMIERNRGHIILIGSIAGHVCYKTGNVYCATKHAIRGISQSLRLDLMGTALRVSEVDPGAVETEFSEVRWDDKERASHFYQGFAPLVAEDIADAVIYCATRPPHVNISELVVLPQAQAPSTEIYRHSS